MTIHTPALHFFPGFYLSLYYEPFWVTYALKKKKNSLRLGNGHEENFFLNSDSWGRSIARCQMDSIKAHCPINRRWITKFLCARQTDLGCARYPRSRLLNNVHLRHDAVDQVRRPRARGEREHILEVRLEILQLALHVCLGIVPVTLLQLQAPRQGVSVRLERYEYVVEVGLKKKIFSMNFTQIRNTNPISSITSIPYEFNHLQNY